MSFQNQLDGGIQVVKPPDLSSQFHPLSFHQPKTQSYYKAVLVPQQSPLYEFGYKVHDPVKMNYQQKSELRLGDAVKGFYRYQIMDGSHFKAAQECQRHGPSKPWSFLCLPVILIAKSIPSGLLPLLYA